MIPYETNEDKEQIKHLLFYQVENLKDVYEDLEEKYYHLNLDFKDKNRVLEFLIRDFKKLAEDMKCLNIYLDNRRNELKNKLNQQNDKKLTNGFHNEDKLSCKQNEIEENTMDYLKDDENELTGLDLTVGSDKSELLTNFQTLINDYVQSLTEYKVFKLDQFKTDVLKIEKNDDCFNLIKLVNNLNGSDLNDKIKNFVNYKRKLEGHLVKLSEQLKEEKKRTEQLNERCPIDLTNLDNLNLEKINLEKSNLNKLDDNDEDSNKNILELKFAILKVKDYLLKLKRLQMNLDREMNSYLNEKETIETRIDSLKNDKRKLLRELRDADARITELTTETMHNQKIIEQLKKN